MILEQIGEVQLPAHDKPGGFDHAAVHGPRGRLYVAHTANDAVDVIDCATNTYHRFDPCASGAWQVRWYLRSTISCSHRIAPRTPWASFRQIRKRRWSR